MNVASTWRMSVLSAARLLCLMLGVVMLSGQAFAHRGHDHGPDRGKAAAAAHATAVIAAPHAARDAVPAPVDADRTAAVDLTPMLPAKMAAVTVAVTVPIAPPAAQTMPSSSALTATLPHHAAAHAPTSRLARADGDLTSGAKHDMPSTCPCSSNCGACSSASCCTGAILPSALAWPHAGQSSLAVAVFAPGAPGIGALPLPRPPNSVRPS